MKYDTKITSNTICKYQNKFMHITEISILALAWLIYSRVILRYHTIYGWWRDITSSILSALQTYSSRSFHFWIWTACSTDQFFSTLPLTSILCKSRLVLAFLGCSCFSPNYRRTWSGRWNSTSQKHISGTVDLHTLLPSMRKLGGRWLKSFPYGSHLTYKSHQVKQPHSKIFP